MVFSLKTNDLLLSLFYQCLYGKGRTLASKYVRVVDFVYSGELEEWNKKMEEWRK